MRANLGGGGRRIRTPHRKILALRTRIFPGLSHKEGMRWVQSDKLRDVALPTVMRKIVEHGLDDGGPLFSSRKP